MDTISEAILAEEEEEGWLDWQSGEIYEQIEGYHWVKNCGITRMK